MIIVRSTQELSSLWKRTTAFTFDPFARNVMKAFGIDSLAIEHMFTDDPAHLILINAQKSALLMDNPTGKCYFSMQKDWFRVQLHPGEKLVRLQQHYIHYLQESIKWEKILDDFFLSPHGQTTSLSLRRFTRQTIGVCAMKSFFGEELFKKVPSFLQNYQDFEDASWKVFYNYPRVFARDLHKVKDLVVDDLVTYLALPPKERPHLAWLFDTMWSELTNLGLGPRDRAGMMMLIIWA